MYWRGLGWACKTGIMNWPKLLRLQSSSPIRNQPARYYILRWSICYDETQHGIEFLISSLVWFCLLVMFGTLWIFFRFLHELDLCISIIVIQVQPFFFLLPYFRYVFQVCCIDIVTYKYAIEYLVPILSMTKK